jgi:calcium-dependent protein kinase
MGCCLKTSTGVHGPREILGSSSERKNGTSTNGHHGVHELKLNYKISASTKVLGAGSFGKVFLSENIADPSFKVAIKVLNKAKLKDNLEAIREEVRILTKLDHPNIVKYYETYDDSKYMYLVMEYCPGGELFEKIA